MSKRVTISLLVVTAAAVALAALSGMASASPAASASKAAKLRVVPIVMHDPGCHWFMVGGKYKLSLTVKGATVFRNVDEAALIFKGKNFVRKLAVGKSLTVAKPGTYHITMVDQAPDDNHLVLVVK
jgi:hypothetical protein